MPKDDSVRVTVRVEENVEIEKAAELDQAVAAIVKRVMCSAGFEDQVVEAVKRAMRNREFDDELIRVVKRRIGRRNW